MGWTTCTRNPVVAAVSCMVAERDCIAKLAASRKGRTLPEYVAVAGQKHLRPTRERAGGRVAHRGTTRQCNARRCGTATYDWAAVIRVVATVSVATPLRPWQSRDAVNLRIRPSLPFHGGELATIAVLFRPLPLSYKWQVYSLCFLCF